MVTCYRAARQYRKKVNEKLFNLYQASYEMVAFDNQRVFSEPGKLISVQPKHEFNLELR